MRIGRLEFVMQRRQYLAAMAQLGASVTLPVWATAGSDALLLPSDSRVPGGIARLSLGPSSSRPKATTAQGIPLLVVGDMIEWTALVGIPLSTQVGIHTITVHDDGGTHSLDYTVLDKRYTEHASRSRQRPWI